ncbi:hypothetical protein L6164_011404 [Bauhinia variegata]|uniref:Uncharacterized protein n=1 Tax=Bauhinia variegata TaxID=167791 RepID=A0ACB9P651_BAUVA|nr:hypothetical protein L6164_011404 [Bauhinia variegata]
MDLPKPLPNRIRTSLTLILIFSLTFFPAISGRNEPSMSICIYYKFIYLLIFVFSFTFFLTEGSASVEVHTKDLKELVLGSRPPRCLNKCLNCRPCMATLVISPHQRNGHKASSVQRDESYYLLSWKCKCGNKFFQP